MMHDSARSRYAIARRLKAHHVTQHAPDVTVPSCPVCLSTISRLVTSHARLKPATLEIREALTRRDLLRIELGLELARGGTLAEELAALTLASDPRIAATELRPVAAALTTLAA